MDIILEAGSYLVDAFGRDLWVVADRFVSTVHGNQAEEVQSPVPATLRYMEIGCDIDSRVVTRSRIERGHEDGVVEVNVGRVAVRECQIS